MRTKGNRVTDSLQLDSFGYFTHEVNRENGLVLDKTAPNWPASIAAVGLGLSAYPVGVERGFMTRDEATERTLTTLRFFAASEQSDSPEATGYNGFYYHFLHMRSGRRAWKCELSTIDTALFIAGALLAAEYFDGATDDEREIRLLAKQLYERIDWHWMLNRRLAICHGWKPETGFLRYRWQGYDESLILYLLALGSPTHPITPRSYEAWCSTFEWKTLYGHEVLYAGPLFIHQMSHIWCDLRGIRDAFMRVHDSDYFENSRRATLIQQLYAIDNPHGYEHYGKHRWGVTASDGPGRRTRTIAGIRRSFHGYRSRGAPFGPDDGTLSPWSVAASLPFAPEIVRPTVRSLRKLHVKTCNPYGFKASFNPAFIDDRDDGIGWVSHFHFAVNEGPTVLMIENHRSGLIWKLMRHCEPLVAGLRAAGFQGGWLDEPPSSACR